MAQVTFQNNPVHTSGNLFATGWTAPVFTLAAADLSDEVLADFVGKHKVSNVFPSVDTGVCAQSTRTFSKYASSLDSAVVLYISADPSFTQVRFRGTEGLDRVVTLSSLRSSLATDYDVAPTDNPLRSLTAYMALVLDENNEMPHSESVTEIVSKSDYDTALTVL